MYVELADKLSPLGLWGMDLRNAVRERLRLYNRQAKLRYVLMIGDSIDLPDPPDDLAPGGTWEPGDTLSEPWNLPTGYYLKAVSKGTILPIYNTLYYADLSDKVSYTYDEDSYQGDYRIYVGVIPVRTLPELTNVLSKTMATGPTGKMTWFFEENCYDPTYVEALLADVQAKTKRLDIKKVLFHNADAEDYVKDTFFKQDGILQIFVHGFPGGNGFSMIYEIFKVDAALFQQVNPLFIDNSCYSQSYWKWECLDEAFLKAPKGPAAVSGSPVYFNGQVTGLDPKYYVGLDAGKSIGNALYDNSYNSFFNMVGTFWRSLPGGGWEKVKN